MTPTEAFARARDTLLRHRTDYEAARREFRWPELDRWNWARDWFDVVAKDNRQTALWLVDESGSEARLSYAELADRSSRTAAYLRRLGVGHGDTAS
jgi:acetyl-CoA synthetase